MPFNRPLPHALIRAHPREALRAAFWVVAVAVLSGVYGLLAGPVVRCLFGGPITGMDAVTGALPVSTWAEAVPVAVVVVAALKAWATRAQVLSQTRLGLRVVAAVRMRAHASLLAQSPASLGRLGGGDLLLRLTEDAERVEQLVSVGMVGAARDVLQVALLLGACVMLDPALAGLFFCVYPLALWPMAALGRKLRRAAGTAAEERGALATEAAQHLRLSALLQAFDAVPWARRRLADRQSALDAAVLRGAALRSLASPLMEFLGALALALTVVYAERRVAAGTLTAEQVISFLACALLLYAPVKNLTRWRDVLTPGQVAWDRLVSLEGEAEETRGTLFTGQQPAPDAAPCIELSGLRVVRGPGRVVELPDAAFLPGRVTAVVGPNGAGKSTLAGVLLGWLVPAAGEVRVDGAPLDAFEAAAWRRSVGWIPQAALLARGSLRENVTLGRPVDAAELARVADLAGLRPLLHRHPAGWDALLDDEGAGLSGGEQRRVALARALVGAPTVLLFDEPEASLDAEAVAALAAALPGLSRDRTVILLTHDQTLIGAADAHVRLDGPLGEAASCSPS